MLGASKENRRNKFELDLSFSLVIEFAAILGKTPKLDDYCIESHTVTSIAC
jgi:hypothetical protein